MLTFCFIARDLTEDCMCFPYLNCAMLHPVISNFTVDLFSQASAKEKNSYSQFTSWGVKSIVCAHNALQQQPVDKRKKCSICWLVFGLSPELCVGQFLALCGCLSNFLLVCLNFCRVVNKIFKSATEKFPNSVYRRGIWDDGHYEILLVCQKGKALPEKKTEHDVLVLVGCLHS